MRALNCTTTLQFIKKKGQSKNRFAKKNWGMDIRSERIHKLFRERLGAVIMGKSRCCEKLLKNIYIMIFISLALGQTYSTFINPLGLHTSHVQEPPKFRKWDANFQTNIILIYHTIHYFTFKKWADTEAYSGLSYHFHLSKTVLHNVRMVVTPKNCVQLHHTIHTSFYYKLIVLCFMLVVKLDH